MGDKEPDSLNIDIPAFLKRDDNNKAEYMKMAESTVTEIGEPKVKLHRAKANGHAKAPARATKAAVKAAGKAKAEAAPKVPAKAKAAPKAMPKAARAIEKAKATHKATATAEKDAYGFRKGSAKSKAVAMYARKNGATLEEVKTALGSVQLNVLSNLEAAGYTVEKHKEEREGARPVTRYILKS